MHFASIVIVFSVALLHLWFLVLEMFLWTKPQGLKTFHNSIEKAEGSKILAANQGLYNGFLSAGLVWGLLHADPIVGMQIQLFFLICVTLAGLYGAATFSKKILWVQGMPAILGIITLVLSQ